MQAQLEQQMVNAGMNPYQNTDYETATATLMEQSARAAEERANQEREEQEALDNALLLSSEAYASANGHSGLSHESSTTMGNYAPHNPPQPQPHPARGSTTTNTLESDIKPMPQRACITLYACPGYCLSIDTKTRL